MIKYLQIIGVIILTLILVMLTVFAVKDIVKNDMTSGDNFFTFMDYFKSEYEGLYIVWNVILGLIVIVSLYFLTLLLR